METKMTDSKANAPQEFWLNNFTGTYHHNDELQYKGYITHTIEFSAFLDAQQWREHYETKYNVTKAACEAALEKVKALEGTIRDYEHETETVKELKEEIIQLNKMNLQQRHYYDENQALRDQVSVAKECISEAIDIIDNAYDGSNEIDRYTTQPLIDTLKTLEAKGGE
jgi:hypothetical protein